MVRTTVSQEELAERADEIVARVRNGELAVVEASGKEAIVLLDALDYRLLRALAACAGAGPVAVDDDLRPLEVAAVRDYLTERIGLGKAAELLDLPRLDLTERFHRLGVPLRLGSVDEDEALAEAAVASAHRS